MPKITFFPTGRTVTVARETELLAAAREAGVEIDAPCGGKGVCGKCIVRVTHGAVDSDSLGVLPAPLVADGYVLACKTRLLDDDVAVEVPEPSSRTGGQISEEDETYLVRRELLPKNWEFDPLAVKWRFRVDPPALEDGLSDLDRLTRAVRREWGPGEVICSLGVMRRAAEALRAEGGVVTATLIRDSDKHRIVRIEPGDATTRHYAVAVDVGTTTVSVQLIDLALGRILATRSDYNDQIACGLDVISRINYARRPERLEELRARIVDTINRLVRRVCEAREVAPEEIVNAVVSGNTTMTHLLLGLPPEHIRLDPYTPTVRGVPYLEAHDVGIEINPDSWVHFSPAVGSYVGGDITAGVLCTDLVVETDAISLFIDIGTNGELVLGNNDFLLSCACSAGPAFEGGGIRCGMRAAVGAIETVEVDPATGVPACRTIGNAKPRGICGTGMIALIANLFLTGWIDPAGKFVRHRASPAIRVDGKHAAYTLANATDSDADGPLVVTEQDVENILRTKAAIYSACALMLDQVGLTYDEVATIYVAGGFGRFLDLEKAIAIGLLPDVPRERFRFIGNASLMGSYMVAVSQEYMQKQLDTANRMTYLELSTDPAYMDQYTGALFLPHTDPAQFPSVTKRLAAVAKGGQS